MQFSGLPPLSQRFKSYSDFCWSLMWGLLWVYWHFFNRRCFLRFIYIFRIVKGQNCQKQLSRLLVQRKQLHSRSLRDKCNLNVKGAKTFSGQRTFEKAASKDWDSLPTQIKKIAVLSRFKRELYDYLRKDDIVHCGYFKFF